MIRKALCSNRPENWLAVSFRGDKKRELHSVSRFNYDFKIIMSISTKAQMPANTSYSG